MNLSDLYAICCLLVWGGAIGFAVVMLCRGRQKIHTADDKFPINAVAAALIVGILMQMILLIGNPNYLSYFLWFFALLLAGTGLITRRFRMQRAGTIFITVGTIFLYLFFTNSGYTSGSDGRLKARLIFFTSTLTDTAQKDKTIYPTGILNDSHPVLKAHVELAEAMKNLTRIPLWHTIFTDLYKNAPLPPFEFQAGTIADNQEALLKHARQEDKSGRTMRPVRRMLYRIIRYAIPIVIIFGLLAVMTGAILLRKWRKYRKEFLMRSSTSELEFLRQCDLPPDSMNGALALLVRTELARCAKVPAKLISGEDSNRELGLLLDNFDALDFILSIEEKSGRSIAEDDDFAIKLQWLASSAKKTVRVRDVVLAFCAFSENTTAEAKQ